MHPRATSCYAARPPPDWRDANGMAAIEELVGYTAAEAQDASGLACARSTANDVTLLFRHISRLDASHIVVEKYA